MALDTFPQADVDARQSHVDRPHIAPQRFGHRAAAEPLPIAQRHDLAGVGGEPWQALLQGLGAPVRRRAVLSGPVGVQLIQNLRRERLRCMAGLVAKCRQSLEPGRSPQPHRQCRLVAQFRSLLYRQRYLLEHVLDQVRVAHDYPNIGRQLRSFGEQYPDDRRLADRHVPMNSRFFSSATYYRFREGKKCQHPDADTGAIFGT